MTSRPEDGDSTEEKAQASTPQLDRLESLAKAAETAAQSKQWRARKSGLQVQEEPSEVRNLNHDAEARAQAEAAMQQMMAKGKGKKPSRW
jgi:predicted Ser/Thr protein kinase